MARIRTVKPEYWSSEQVMSLTLHARLAFIGLWNFCDDGGNHPASAKTFKAEVFPSDDLSAADVQGLADELLAQGLIKRYEVAGKAYWHVTGWKLHQRIDKPTIKHPAPMDVSPNAPSADPSRSAGQIEAIADHSASDGRSFSESSPNAQGGVVESSPPEGNGDEGKGEEGKEANAFVGRADLPNCDYQGIVDAYHESLPDLPSVKLLQDSRKKALAKTWRWVLTSKTVAGERRATNATEALAWFADYFSRAASNDFLMGRTERAGRHANWKANLDFLLTEKGMRHVIERTEVQQ